jgi:hypothetical protein
MTPNMVSQTIFGVILLNAVNLMLLPDYITSYFSGDQGRLFTLLEVA